MEQKKYLWGIGNIGEGVVTMVTSTYFIIFLTDTALLPLWMVSLISTTGSILDFLLVPLSGALMSGCKPMKWGRYRSWLLICPPLVVLFYMLGFTVTASPVRTALCALLGYVGGKTAWNLVYSANVTLTAVLSREPTAGTRFTAQKMMGSNIGRMLGNALTPALVAACAAYMSEAASYRTTILIMGVFYMVSSLIHFQICADVEESASQASRCKQLSVRELLGVIAVEPRLLLTLLIDLTSNIASLVLPSLAVYYYKYCAETPGLVSIHMLIIGFGGLAGASLVRLMGSRIARHTKSVLLILYALVAASLLSIRIIPYSTLYFMCAGGAIAAFTGMTSPFELTLYMKDAAIYTEKTGKDATGFIMSLSNLPVKFAAVIKSVLIPFALMTSGYAAGSATTPQMRQAIVNAYTLIPVFFPICGILLLSLTPYAASAGNTNKPKA